MQVIMKILVLLTAVLCINAEDESFATAMRDANVCYNNAAAACNLGSGKDAFSFCNATYGGIEHSVKLLQSYANLHINQSIEYLLMASHFGNYQMNRPGFEKMYRKYSDEAWEDAINIIQFIGKRGEKMDFQNINWPDEKTNGAATKVGLSELYELQSLAKAIDMQKVVATKAIKIHEVAIRKHNHVHDPDISSYLEEHFVHKHSENIRKLAGHVTDLSKMLRDENDHVLSLFIFDQYLSE